MYQERFYRKWTETHNLHKLWIVVHESDLLLYTSEKINRESAENIVKGYRSQIEDYIQKHRDFYNSLSPVEPLPLAPPIIKDMCYFSSLTGIGPFSSVAGAIAQYVGEELLEYSKEVIVENGGDLFVKIQEVRIGGVFFYQGNKRQIIRFKIRPTTTTLGISSSSSTIGDSLSFGNVELACVVADNAILSDTCATLLGNLVKKRKDINPALSRIKSIEGVRAALIVFQNEVFLWGEWELV